MRESKFVLKATEPKKWRQYLLGVWCRNQGKPAVATLHQSKLLIGKQIIQAWADEHPDLKLPVTFDSWYTQPAFCRFLTDTVKLPYVGTLNASDKVLLQSGEMTVGDFAKQLKKEHETAIKKGDPPIFKPVIIRYKGTKEQYFSYCKTHRIPKFGRQRLVINFRQADLTDKKPVFYICNRLRWQAKGITAIRCHRWPVEVYYEEGKAEGLDQYQLRDFVKGISRHIALVTVVYSLLRAAQQDTVLRDNLQRQLKLILEGTVAFWRRTTEAENLWNLAVLISSGLLAGKPIEVILAPLLQTMV
ncbi:MAG: transposase [Chloroflexi bacterium]|nr:transposase [Chloroflexota bacterium]